MDGYIDYNVAIKTILTSDKIDLFQLNDQIDDTIRL